MFYDADRPDAERAGSAPVAKLAVPDPQAAALLERRMTEGRLPHALLFLGPTGAAQDETARWLARRLFCAEAKNPCGTCSSCRLSESDSHPDFHRLVPADGTSTIKVEAVRTLIAQASLKPFQAETSFFLINPAEAMNEIAQNALLKTLEEPPGHAYFVLVSHSLERVLPTLRSRSQTVSFTVPSIATERNQQAIGAFLARLTRGPSGPVPDFGRMDREELGHVFDGVAEVLRMALRLRANVPDPDVRTSGANASILEAWDVDRLIEAIETVGAFKQKIAEQVNVKLALSVFWREL